MHLNDDISGSSFSNVPRLCSDAFHKQKFSMEIRERDNFRIAFDVGGPMLSIDELVSSKTTKLFRCHHLKKLSHLIDPVRIFAQAYSDRRDVIFHS